MKTIVAKISWFSSGNLRLDASSYLGEGNISRGYIQKSPYEIFKIKDCSYNTFYGGRSKRVYVSNKNHGVPFIGSSDMLKSDLSGIKYISIKNTLNLNSALLKKDWILVSRSGTVGNTMYTNADFENKAASEHIIRIIPNEKVKSGFLYAYLSSKIGYSLLTQGMFGAVIQHIEPDYIESIPIPDFPSELQQIIHNYITECSELRVEANMLLEAAERVLMEKTGLRNLDSDDYDYFGSRSNNRIVSCFSKNISNIGTTSINAFNNSNRISKTIQEVKNTCKTLTLYNVLDDDKLFSTGSFPRIEVHSDKGIILINQSDIFDTIIKGKRISKRKVKVNNLVKYGEVLIAGVGTLGESEIFCKVAFANESIQGQLISGEFIRMKTNKNIPSGYLYAWLNTDYGFRFIRSTQAGTKQCRPIQRLLLEMPVPFLDKEIMMKIHTMVTKAHTMRYEANLKEIQAIQLVEIEIEQWQL